MSLNQLTSFEINASSIYLWVFKKSSASSKFKASYVQIHDSLKSDIKQFIHDEFELISETHPYTYISQVNENSCLTLNTQDTDFLFLKTLVDRPETENRVSDKKELNGTFGYLIKLVNNGSVLYAVRRSTKMWKTAYKKSAINVIFNNGELSADEDNTFSIEKNFDFYVVDQKLFVRHKSGFESVLSYKNGYKQSFQDLCSTDEFQNLFSDTQPLINFVGDNSINLRRMAVVRDKNIFLRPGFIDALKIVNSNRNWGISFDSNNKIILNDDNLSDVVKILLDHRLLSEITNNIYDVPDATQI